MKTRKFKIFAVVMLAAAVARLAVDTTVAEVAADSPKTVVLGGKVIGVKLYTKGVHVLKLSDVETANGQKEPSKKAGIKVGDYITHVNAEEIESYEQFSLCLQNKSEVKLTVNRDGEILTVKLKPAMGKDGVYRAGLWVRDSIAGLGTLTFFDPETKIAVALGHGITDSETAKLLMPARGKAYNASVTSYEKGKSGDAGALNGAFADESGYLGKLIANTKTGAYFSFEKEDGIRVPVAKHDEVKEGEAVIYSTIAGEEAKPYSVKIEKVIKSSIFTTKGMLIKVTDEELLSTTGGIVCGMSGSPIIQNGKLVGAVTHVFVNDPTRGYGIFIENMLAEAGKIK